MTKGYDMLNFHKPMVIYRFAELKAFHGIEDEKPLVGAAGPQKMATGLLCRNYNFLIMSYFYLFI